MSRLSTDTPMKLEKTNLKAGCLRRKSTGYSSLKSDEPTSSTPNYLRASTGSCHDFCKYGIKGALPIKPWRPVGRKLDKNGNAMLLLPVSDENPRRKRILTSPRKQHHQTNVRVKPEPLKTTDSFDKQPKKNFLKSSSNACIDTRTPKTRKKSSSFPPVSGPPALPLSSNIRINKSSQKKTPHSEIENYAEKKTSVEDVPEKIIHVIEPRDENNAQESYSCTEFTTLTSNENQNSNKEKKATRVSSKIISNEAKDNATEKLKFRRAKVLEDKSAHKKNDDETSILRHRAVKSRDVNSVFMNIVIEETANKLVKKKMSKVKALVGAFESVIKIQDSLV